VARPSSCKIECSARALKPSASPQLCGLNHPKAQLERSQSRIKITSSTALNKIPSNNFDNRPRGTSIDTVVLHSTHMSFKDSVKRLCDTHAKVSCHYLINTDGKLYKMVDDKHRAWHAGKSYWREHQALNDNSIGIELVDTTSQNVRLKKFPKAQMKSLIKLLKSLSKRYKIPRCNIVAHSDIAPDRKDDPGEHFDWPLLFAHGIVIHHNVDVRDNRRLINNTSSMAKIKAIQRLMKKFGYKLKLSGSFDKQTKEVITAFRRRFNPLALKQKHFGTADYRILEYLTNAL
jgi:N-acetylmuramoyl-L-alanine amidase